MGVNGGMKTVDSACTKSISLDMRDHKEFNALCCMLVYHSIHYL